MGPMGGMRGGHMGQGAEGRLPDGEGFHVLRLAVRQQLAYDKTIPDVLSTLVTPPERSGLTRTFELAQGMMMRWTINGRTFEMDRALFSTQRNAREVWEVTNAEASMQHPMHLHGFQFQVMERRGSPQQARQLAVDDAGRQATDLGWKDTVLVWPGETVVFAVDFSHSFEGEQTYLWHCHNLEHEDQGMMVNYRVA
jgi:blue copper oxidase